MGVGNRGGLVSVHYLNGGELGMKKDTFKPVSYDAIKHCSKLTSFGEFDEDEEQEPEI